MTPRRRELPDTGLPEEDLPDRALLERIWSILSRWAVPVMMTLAYILLAETSDTDTTGKLLMATGLMLVMIGWFVFRALTESAGLSRALSVGDVAYLLAIAERRLPRARKPAVRARLLVARALGQQLRGNHAGALAAIDAIRAIGVPGVVALLSDLQPLAVVVLRAALIELDRSSELLGNTSETSFKAPLRIVPSAACGAMTTLADGQSALVAGELDDAAASFASVVDDIRAGSVARAMAHLYSARIAHTRGDSAACERHRVAAAALASPDASWLRPPPPRTRAD